MNGRDRLLEQVAATIRARGLYTQGVLASYPGEVDFGYTVGNYERNMPELIVFGVQLGVGARLLSKVTHLLRTGRVPSVPGIQVDSELIGRPSPLAIRLGEVAPRWARRHGVVAFNHYGLDDPAAIPFRQVILSDELGNFWDEDGYSEEMDQFQPDLSREPLPWRRPHVVWADRREPPSCDIYALIPIIAGGEEKGRSEAVPATLLEGDVVRVERPPVLADWVTTGTILCVDAAVVSTGRDLPEGRAYRRVERESPQVHLVWWIHVHDEEEHAALVGRIRDELDIPEITMVTTPQSVHVAAPPRQAPRVRSRMRRFVRDGLAQEWEPYHRGAIRCHPDCFEYETQWP